jgi:hypothetical protein
MCGLRRRVREKPLAFERCEARSLATLVFIFNGNGFGATTPSTLTANAATVLQDAGHQAVQLATPAMVSSAAFYGLAHEVQALAHGQPIGLVGFSAGGTLAERMAALPELHVKDVLACYSPPDLRSFFGYHQNDRFAAFVGSHINANPAVINLFSGLNPTQAHVVTDFGLFDHAVVATPSAAAYESDYPHGQVYYYDSGHGVSIDASPSALADFLAHL